MYVVCTITFHAFHTISSGFTTDQINRGGFLNINVTELDFVFQYHLHGLSRCWAD